MADSYWKGKRVCVTGGAGFVGSHLVDLLLSVGAEVVVIDDLSTGHKRNVHKDAKLIVADVTDPIACNFAFRFGSVRHDPVDVVFNLAATVAGVIFNQNNNALMFHDNIKLLSAPVLSAESVGVGTFMQTSSVCVYAPQHNHPSIEPAGFLGEPHQANGGYSWAKRAGERVAQLSSIPKVVVVRPSNIFGPRDYFDRERSHVIPALIIKAEEDEVVEVFGNSGTVREFIFVRDVAYGMMKAVEKGLDREVYNLGCNGGNVINMLDLARSITDLVSPGKQIRTVGGEGGDALRFSDSTKALKDLGWYHSTSLDEGLVELVHWRNNERSK